MEDNHLLDTYHNLIRRGLTKITQSDVFGKRFVKGSFWLFIGNLFAQIFTLSASIILARLLGKLGFGEFGMVNSTIGTFGLFAGMGLGLTCTKYIAEYRVVDPKRAGSILGFSTIIAIITGLLFCIFVLLIAPYLSINIINAPHLIAELRICSIVLLTSSLNGMQMGALAGFEAFRLSSKINIVRGIITILFSTLGTYYFGLIGAIWATAISGLIICILSNIAINEECKNNNISINYSLTSNDIEILKNYSLPALFSNLLVTPALWIGNTLLVNQVNGYSEMGVFNAANQWRTALMFLPSIFGSVALPILSSGQSDESSKKNNIHLLEITQSIAVISTLPLAILIIYLGEFIMNFYGKDFAYGVPILVFIIVGISINTMSNTLGLIVQSKGRMWLGVLMNFSWAAVYVGFVASFVSSLSALSLGLGYALAYLFLFTWGHIYLRKDLPKGLFTRTYYGILYLIFASVLSLVLPSNLRIIFSIPILIISIVFCFLFCVSPYFKNSVKNIINKMITND